MMTLDEKLAHLRKKEGMSQMELAEKLNVSRQAVSRWEAGDSKPSTENLQALCKLYHIPLDYLFNESEDNQTTHVPVAPASERDPGRDIQNTKNKRVRQLVIGAALFALLICCFFWYQSSQKNNDLTLHTILGEGDTSLEIPEFNLDWD